MYQHFIFNTLSSLRNNILLKFSCAKRAFFFKKKKGGGGLGFCWKMNECDSWSSYKQSSKPLESGYTPWCINTIQAIFLPVPTSKPAPFPQERPNHLSLLPQSRTCPSITPERRCEEAYGFNGLRLHRGDMCYRPSCITGLAEASRAWWITQTCHYSFMSIPRAKERRWGLTESRKKAFLKIFINWPWFYGPLTSIIQ